VRCQIHTAVWGAWHTDTFIKINLPSLLAARNLPAFADQIETAYVISTRASDAQTIEQSSAYRQLKTLMPVKFEIYRNNEFGAPIATHKKLWHDGLASARDAQAFCIVNPPDIVWANGCFAAMASRILAGKKIIYANFPRALDETFNVEAEKHRHGEAISIEPRVMVDMMLRHQHPLNAAYLRDSDQFPHHAEHVFWPVPNEGLMMRTLAALVFGIDPIAYEVDADFLLKSVKDPNDLEFVEDSDDVSGVSLAPLGKDQTWYSTSRALDIDEVSSWWLAFDDPAFLHLAQARFYLHTRGTDSPAWRRAKQMSDFFVFQAITSREIVRIGRLLRRNGCTIAAEIVATALYAARLRRRWRWRPPVSIVVPNDAALAPYRDEIDRQLLSPGNEEALLDFVFSHVISGRVSTDAKTATTLNDRALTIARGTGGMAIDNANVIQTIELPQNKQLYIVDRILSSSKLLQAASKNVASAVA
jgi:hypothetical protein